MTRKITLLHVLLALSVLCGATLAADGPLAQVRENPVGIDLLPTFGTAESWQLTVAGADGYYTRETLGAGASALTIDVRGLADGSYNWELSPNLPARQEVRDDRFVRKVYEAPKQFGSFRILDGTLVRTDLLEEDGRGGKERVKGGEAVPGAADLGPVARAQVFVTDVVVQGSLCTGFDCVNGENFGFDTMRAKENNLRIHFDDTSNSASFPSNDWRIVANDTSNGGANYLGIEDSTAGRVPFRVEAGARANALYVEADGDIGIGTMQPAVDLEVVTGNTPTLRLQQDGSSGFTPQTFDVAANEANFFVRDVTNGARLSFRIRPGAPESSIDIAASGDVGIGTSSPASELHVRRTDSSGTTLTVENANGAAKNVNLRLQNFTSTWDLRNNTQGRLAFNDGTGNLFVLEPTSGDLAITGQLTTGGTTCGMGGCDGVFRNEIETIEEHAAAMWTESHLPAVGPTVENAPFNITAKTTGMLNELEKAHIYIEQLHKRLQSLEQRLEDLSSVEGD